MIVVSVWTTTFRAQDRIHRISQSRACYVTNLLMPDSIDEWVNELLIAKQAAAQLSQGDTSVEEFRGRMAYDFGDVLHRVLDPK